jgi:hypothetical protein
MLVIYIACRGADKTKHATFISLACRVQVGVIDSSGMTSCRQYLSKDAALWRLRELAVVEGRHLSVYIASEQERKFISGGIPSNLNQDSLDAVISVPMSKTGQFRVLDLAICLADKGQIDPRDEINDRRLLRIVFAACDPQTIYAVLMHGL